MAWERDGSLQADLSPGSWRLLAAKDARLSLLFASLHRPSAGPTPEHRPCPKTQPWQGSSSRPQPTKAARFCRLVYPFPSVLLRLRSAVAVKCSTILSVHHLVAHVPLTIPNRDRRDQQTRASALQLGCTASYSSSAFKPHSADVSHKAHVRTNPSRCPRQWIQNSL